MTTSRITVYQKPFTLLTEAGVDFEKVDYFVEHPERVREIL